MPTSAAPATRRRAAVLSAVAFVIALLLATPQAVADIYRSPAGTYEVKGAILGEYRSLGGPAGLLGFPLTNELTTPIRTEGRYSVFQGGSIYWTAATGAHEVHGDIRGRWGALGWENSAVGFPVTNERPTPDGRGRFNYFEHGSIYWTPATRAHEVRGAILAHWGSQGWETSPLGYPITDELGTPDRYGRYNVFERGSIYWSPASGAHSIGGAIRDRWAALGWENGTLGFPMTRELPTPDGRGRFNYFEGGSIYWSPTTGAHEVRGAILDRWASQGWEDSLLGYPISGDYALAGGRAQDFECGVITSAPGGGTELVYNCDPSTGELNCTQVWNLIGRPVLRGEYGYMPQLDPDGSGVACEFDPR